MRKASAKRRRRALVCCAVCMALTAGIAAYTIFLSWKSPEVQATGSSLPVQQESRLPEEPVWADREPAEIEGIDPSRPLIALSVDDSVTSLTSDYCRVLQENGCTATFFAVGYLAEESPEIVQELADAGMEIGNHSYSHQQLAGLGSEKIARQISQADELLGVLSGKTPALFRPPYGRVNQEVLDAAGHPVILWSLDVQDAVLASSETVLERLLEAKDGDIVRVHDGMEITLRALEEGLPLLREAGMQVTTISSLFAVRGYEPLDGQKYDSLPERAAP